jgi:hypothetical protein
MKELSNMYLLPQHVKDKSLISPCKAGEKKSKAFSYDPKSTRNSQVKPFETVGTNASPAHADCNQREF